MRKLLLFILILSSSGAMAQMPDYGLYNIHISDSAKIIRTQVKPVSGTVFTRPGLLYYWFGSNTIHEQQGGFSGKLLNGSYEESDRNHHLIMQGGFKAGLKDGVWKTWNEGGRLGSIITWDEGVKTGKFAYYDAGGNETQSGSYDHDLLHGKITYHTGTDSVKTIQYKNGKIVPAKNGSFLKRIHIFKKKAAGAPQPKTP
ncbi:toxin-antitoxin system YwqK family antitoxin [Mucilaginibacter sp. 3215]|uniref:toxin-antitoxin system YwqK family antitoxin n=1 Tax=Mucilaginibacter sp. 3215 TaxID=3373912 RepID=UPI003D1F1F4B